LSVHAASSGSTVNRLLALLPREEYQRLLQHMKRVHLSKGKVLYEAGDTVRHCYFPLSGMCSLLSTTEGGETVEVSMVGNEGMAGIPAVLEVNTTPYRVMAQIAADAMQIRAEDLRREFNRGGRLHSLLLRYTHALLCQVSQSAVCNRFHTVEKRLCRWLLVTRDRVHSDTVPLTQEFLSHMLGSPRTHVTATAATLQRENLIRYTRGRITITDLRRLEATSCECYRVVKAETDAFLNAGTAPQKISPQLSNVRQ
jgi:CRP-like cAMP-binding protein